MRYDQLDLFDENKEYNDFVEKFKPKKTTDDCYTPTPVYEAVLAFAVNEYSLQGREIVRPFYPDGDYEAYLYPDNCVVIDNPPFSILAKIIDFYNARGIDYFLFAPGMTVISTAGERANIVISNSSITYENGAIVKTAFITNLGQWKIHVSAELHEAVKTAVEQVAQEKRIELPKYAYPDAVLTSALIEKIANRGQTLKIPAGECHFIRSLDHQKKQKKTLFGAGFLLSEKATAEKAAAEKAAAEKAAADRAAAEKAAAEKAAADRAAAQVWQLSERERKIIAIMSH